LLATDHIDMQCQGYGGDQVVQELVVPVARFLVTTDLNVRAGNRVAAAGTTTFVGMKITKREVGYWPTAHEWAIRLSMVMPYPWDIR
jgi:hypothetical protein